MFAIGALLISTLQLTGMLGRISTWLKPLTVSWLGLPEQASTAFIMGIVRRDFGAAGLYELHLTASQIVIALITITLFVPCIASVLIIFKERARKEAFLMWISTFAVSFMMGGLVHMFLQWYERFPTAVQSGLTALTIAACFSLILLLMRFIWPKRRLDIDAPVSF